MDLGLFRLVRWELASVGSSEFSKSPLTCLCAGNPAFLRSGVRRSLTIPVMNSSDKRTRHDDEDRSQVSQGPSYHNSHVGPGHDAPGNESSRLYRQRPSNGVLHTPDKSRSEFTLLVAGCRGGKYYSYPLPQAHSYARTRQNLVPAPPS